MHCKNHPDVQDAVRCCACGSFFCANCLAEIGGRKFCERCKVLTLSEQEVALQESGECKEAASAMTYGIIGLFCLGFILGPFAIMKAMEAKRKIRLNPALTGSEKANRAVAFGIAGIILWTLIAFIKIINALPARHV